ncbi:MAG: FAD-dependent oxidoreductase, partial [Actinomycetia bacterium]|nr:FAD-dependent oxidoreductase [Actinomycetes bacterium]
TGKLRPEIDIPVMASNRINTPDVAEEILAAGDADLISMARPLLADPEFVAKTEQGRTDEINTCIACNQACLDHIFVNEHATCLVNPRAARETELRLLPVPTPARKRVAVVGAGPAGLAASTSLAERGHQVDLYEADAQIGGQFRLAMRIPGKEEFAETLRYYRRRIDVLGVRLHLESAPSIGDLTGGAYDEVIVATGVEPRVPSVPGVDHPSVVTYAQLLRGEASAGERVAVMGAGGIGFDVSEFLLHSQGESVTEWMARWGVTDPSKERGGLTTKLPIAPTRSLSLLQRKETSLGKGLAKTSGWVHRMTLRDAGVEMLPGVAYERIDDRGLHITVDGAPRVIETDTIVLCTGQESVRDLAAPVAAAGVPVHVIGGADVAAELDAERAIKQATELAATL